jgi:hypothetical protein
VEDDVEHDETPEPGPQAARTPFAFPPPGPPIPPAPGSHKVRNVLILLAVVIVALAVMGRIGRDKVKATDLDAGMCIQMPTGASFSEAHKRSCTSAHDAEIIGWVDDVSIADVDLDPTTPSEAATRCESLFLNYAGSTVDASDYKLGYFAKKGSSATSDVLCYVRSAADVPLTQSVQTTS